MERRAALAVGVADCLRGLRGESVLYLPTPGNAGDSLVQMGAYQALARAGVGFTPIRPGHDVDGRTVVVGGGGNLVPLYRELRRALLDGGLLRRCGRLIVLPHTIRGNEDLLAAMDGRVTLFCRDPESFQQARAHAPAARVLLEHDMALHLDVARFDAEATDLSDAPALFERLTARWGRSFAADDRTTVRNLFRADAERLGPEPPPDNLDLSLLLQRGTWPEEAMRAVYCLFQAIRRSGEVRTDRLHVAIAASLVGRPCQRHDNSYGKNAAVYRHTIARYASPGLVTFVAGAPA